MQKKYQRLDEDNRLSRRTIADALEVLRTFADFKADDHATIHIGLLKLPSSDVVGMIDLEFFAQHKERTYLVSLPTSKTFRAARTGGSGSELFNVVQLDGAVVDSAGITVLADNTHIRAVEAIPAHLPLEPSDLDWRIVHHLIAMTGTQKLCYRHWRSGVKRPFRQMVPKYLGFVKFQALSKLKPPPLKAISAYISSCDPTLKKMSRQKIADTLCTFGIRIPKPRPRISRRNSAIF